LFTKSSRALVDLDGVAPSVESRFTGKRLFSFLSGEGVGSIEIACQPTGEDSTYFLAGDLYYLES
jgi:hypothetical protein